MKTQVTYKISKVCGKYTYIHEYWDEILVFEWKVYKIYRGGDILDFMNKNNASRIPNFDGIDEYHRQTFIFNF